MPPVRRQSIWHSTVYGKGRSSCATRRARVRRMQSAAAAAPHALEVLSGDSIAATTAFARSFPGLVASGGLVPEAKLARLQEAVARGDVPVMVGDGINDAPALSAAAVGVTLESGTDLAREVADATILGGDLRRLPWIRELAVRTLQVARINLFEHSFINLIGIGLAVQGLFTRCSAPSP